MITQDYRPRRFSEVLFQDLPKKVLKSIAKDPEGKPRTILLSGPFGCGKTTLAKIFARALNYPDGQGDVAHGAVPNDRELETAGIYSEYDSSIIGNVATLRELQETFYFSRSGIRRIILFDEAQVISREAQSSLLKVTEDNPSGVWFIFATTHPDDLLPALRSRSLELELTVAPDPIIEERVNYLSHELGMEINDDDKQIIVDRANGHFRNCDMMFDLYRILGDDFASSLANGKALFYKFTQLNLLGESDRAREVLNELRMSPIAQLRVDFEHFLVDLSHAVSGSREFTYLESMPKTLGVKAFTLAKYYLSPWGLGGFTNDRTFEMFMWSFGAVAKSLGGGSK